MPRTAVLRNSSQKPPCFQFRSLPLHSISALLSPRPRPPPTVRRSPPLLRARHTHAYFPVWRYPTPLVGNTLVPDASAADPHFASCASRDNLSFGALEAPGWLRDRRPPTHTPPPPPAHPHSLPRSLSFLQPHLLPRALLFVSQLLPSLPIAAGAPMPPRGVCIREALATKRGHFACAALPPATGCLLFHRQEAVNKRTLHVSEERRGHLRAHSSRPRNKMKTLPRALTASCYLILAAGVVL
jgi:hypothetical protein